jgi:tRNA (guanine-N7-)-methyltransferase
MRQRDRATADAPWRNRGAFHGRRKGKALRPHHATLIRDSLPALRLDPASPTPHRLAALFPHPVDDVHLEIGFGGGEHLAMRAAASPAVGFIGCEAYVNGVAKMLDLIERGKLENLRLWDDDATRVIDWLPEASVGRIYVLYPDPWPKRRHRKRRLLGEAMLGRLARIMRPGAELRFATDIDDYAAYVLAQASRLPQFAWTAERARDWLTPWAGWRSTRYEEKALREGRRPGYFTLCRVSE